MIITNRSGLRTMATLALAAGALAPIGCAPSVPSPIVGTWTTVMGGLPKNGWFYEGDSERLSKILALGGKHGDSKTMFGMTLTLKPDGTFTQGLWSSGVGIDAVGRYSVSGNHFQMTSSDILVMGKSVKKQMSAELASPFNPTGTFKREKDGKLILTMNGSDLLTTGG